MRDSGLNTCVLVSLCSVYLDHLHVLAPVQVDPKQRVLPLPAVADHRHGGHSPPHEAATINLRLTLIKIKLSLHFVRTSI